METALIIIANPSPASFSHALAGAAEPVLSEHGYEIVRHDLYAERFDPVQPVGESANTSSTDESVELHCDQLSRAELILIFHPNWWGQPPAILKGWVDRVFRLNTAYGYPAGTGYAGVPFGLLRARHALVFNTSNTPPEREAEVFGDPLDILWKKCIFGLCGVRSVVRRMYAPMADSTSAQREAWLADARLLVATCAKKVR